MKKFFVSIYKTCCDFFDRYFVVLTLISGIICLYYGIRNDNYHSDITKLLHTIGSLSLASGIFAGIAKSNQFTEIYKKIFRDIVYAEEHLDVRSDLEQIWENITQSLSNKKFSKISDMMRSNIKKYFLPLNHDYYYDDFTIDISIEFSATNPDYIVVSEKTYYTIICEDEDLAIDNKFLSGIKVDLSNKELTTYELKKLYIENVLKNNITVEKKYDGNVLWLEYKNTLKGQKSYTIKREEVKHYNLNYNCLRRHLAVWLYKDITLDISYPKSLNIDFYNMGVLDQFKVEDKSTSSFNRFKAQYKGLIYKNQGFFLHLRKK